MLCSKCQRGAKSLPSLLDKLLCSKHTGSTRSIDPSDNLSSTSDVRHGLHACASVFRPAVHATEVLCSTPGPRPEFLSLGRVSVQLAGLPLLLRRLLRRRRTCEARAHRRGRRANIFWRCPECRDSQKNIGQMASWNSSTVLAARTCAMCSPTGSGGAAALCTSESLNLNPCVRFPSASCVTWEAPRSSAEAGGPARSSTSAPLAPASCGATSWGHSLIGERIAFWLRPHGDQFQKKSPRRQ